MGLLPATAATTIAAADAALAAPLAIRVLGSPEVLLAADSARKPKFETMVARDLVLYLVDCPAGAFADVLQAAFWPESPQNRASGALSSTVARARRALGRCAITYQAGRYHLARPVGSTYDADVFALLTRAAAMTADANDRAGHLAAALDLVRGENLDGLTHDWADTRRRAVEHEVTGVTLALADTHARLYAWPDAERRYREVLARDPLREDAHRGLMHVHVARGNSALALRHYAELEEILAREVGARPDPRTRALVDALVAPQ